MLPRLALVRLPLALALCLPAFAAFAAPVDDGAPFPASAQTTASGAQAQNLPAVAANAKAELNPIARIAPASPSLADRALLLAEDLKRMEFKRLLSPMTIAPLALPAASTAGAAAPVAAAPAASAGGETGASEPALAQQGDGKIKSVLQKALALLGTPYRWGGTDPDKGLDCSGLVGYVFRNALGIELPRVSRDMARNGELITDRAKLTAGDLVFFGRKGRVNHVGIYVGEGRFVHAPSRGKDVTVSSLEKGYWSGRFLQARRLTTDGI